MNTIDLLGLEMNLFATVYNLMQKVLWQGLI